MEVMDRYSLQGALQIGQSSERSFLVFSTQEDLGSCYSLNIYDVPPNQDFGI